MSTIHLISHTHWDREWYLTFQQFRLKLIHLMDRLLDILENNPDYKSFLLDGQAIMLEDYLQIRPERESDIKHFVEDGRLFIGPWYISPDEFLVSPESHVRNLLEGNRLCQKYGKRMSIGYLPDTFGHIGQMPQILLGFEIDRACFWRGLDDQPIELTWKSPDGSSVLLSYLRDSYGNAANLPTGDPERFIKGVHEICQSLSPFSSTNQILLMHGTDHMEPLTDLSGVMRTYREISSENELIHSNLPFYFNAVHKQTVSAGISLPTITGELRSCKHSPLLQGVLSTRIWLKQRNHMCESDLLKWVEPLHAWSSILEPMQSNLELGQSNHNHQYLTNQIPIIRYAWKLLMQCHPHDSICGTSIDQVANEMRARFDQVDQINHELIIQNMHRISAHIDTTFTNVARQSGSNSNIITSIIVFNPNDQPQSGLIKSDIMLDDRYSSFELIDDQETSLPYDQKGLGFSELISMTMDKKGLKQGLGMVSEGNVAGMVIREFDIKPEGNKAVIRATISDHGLVDITRWKQGMAKLDRVFADPGINEFIVHAYSDPEIILSFVAQDVPGHGYRCYWVRGKKEAVPKTSGERKLNPLVQVLLPVINIVAKIPFVSHFLMGRKHKPSKNLSKIENEYFVVEASAPEGTISVTDLCNHQAYQGLNRFIDGADCGDLYNYCPPVHDQSIHAQMTAIEREENKISQKLFVHYEIKLPVSLSVDRKSRSRELVVNKIVSTITLVHGLPRVDIHTEIENLARDHRLKVHFPAPFTCSTAYYDGHYEHIERPIGVPAHDNTWEEQPRPEVPQRLFTLVTDERSSLTIANRGLPEVEVLKKDGGNVEIAVTLLRCVGWLSRDDLTTRKGHAGPMGITVPEAQMIGKYVFDYSIIPGNNKKETSIHQAYAFNAPLSAMISPVHPGSLSSRNSLVENSNPNFIIMAIKTGDESSSLLIRGFNILSIPTDVNLKPYRYFNQAHLVNLQEEQIQPLSIDSQGQVHLRVEGNKIYTICFKD